MKTFGFMLLLVAYVVWLAGCVALCVWDQFAFYHAIFWLFGASALTGGFLGFSVSVSLADVSGPTRFLLYALLILPTVSIFLAFSSYLTPSSGVAPADLRYLALLIPIFIAFTGLAGTVLRLYRKIRLHIGDQSSDNSSVTHWVSCAAFCGVAISLVPLFRDYIDHPETELFTLYALIAIISGASIGLPNALFFTMLKFRFSLPVLLIVYTSVGIATFLLGDRLSQSIGHPFPGVQLPVDLILLALAALSGLVVMAIVPIGLKITGARLEWPRRRPCSNTDKPRETLHPLDCAG